LAVAEERDPLSECSRGCLPQRSREYNRASMNCPSFSPDFSDGSVVSAWRLRFFPGNPSVSDHHLLKRPRNPMGDSQNDALRVDCDRQIKLEFHGATVTSDAGLLPYRELDDALGLTRTAAGCRGGSLLCLPFPGMALHSSSGVLYAYRHE